MNKFCLIFAKNFLFLHFLLLAFFAKQTLTTMKHFAILYTTYFIGNLITRAITLSGTLFIRICNILNTENTSVNHIKRIPRH